MKVKKTNVKNFVKLVYKYCDKITGNEENIDRVVSDIIEAILKNEYDLCLGIIYVGKFANIRNGDINKFCIKVSHTKLISSNRVVSLTLMKGGIDIPNFVRFVEY